jgi:acyl carrier protein
MADILPRFRRCLIAHLTAPPGGEIDLDTELREVGLDSMSAISLLLDLEKEFGITFPDDTLAPEVFRTGATLLETVQRLAARKGGAA